MATHLCPYRYQSNVANKSLDTILSIQPKDSSSGGGETRESIVYHQAQEMLDKLPSDYIPHEVKERLQSMGALAPMNIFLRQEIDRMEKVITTVRNTLKDLKLAIDGTIIMSEVSHQNSSYSYHIHEIFLTCRTCVMLWTTYMMQKYHEYGERYAASSYIATMCRINGGIFLNFFFGSSTRYLGILLRSDSGTQSCWRETLSFVTGCLGVVPSASG